MTSHQEAQKMTAMLVIYMGILGDHNVNSIASVVWNNQYTHTYKQTD